jgi:hypothetical protein
MTARAYEAVQERAHEAGKAYQDLSAKAGETITTGVDKANLALDTAQTAAKVTTIAPAQILL